MQWYYARNDQRFGPVEEAEIRRMAAAGELRPDDLVWNAAMGAEWRTASSVAGLLPATPALPVAALAGPPPPGGTGGRTPNAELTARARAALSGRWGLAIGGCLLYYVVAMGIGMVGSMLPFLGAIIAQLVVGGPLALGFIHFALALARRREAEIGQLFSGFRHWGRAMGTMALVMAFVLLWALLSVLPFLLLGGLYLAGQPSLYEIFQVDNPRRIVATLWPAFVMLGFAFVSYTVVLTIISLRYAFTLFALADDPGLGPRGALRRSIELVRGRKGKLFLFYLRFVGWSLLAVFTCGIGYLWLFPYMTTSIAAFYDDLKA